MDRKGGAYKVDEGGGAFYGPKIDIKIKDAVGRVWQCSTVQCDFNLPERFGLEYVAADQARERPIMIHRAIFGSVERFFGILVENYAGDFPLWFAPEQLRLLAVNDDVLPYCREIVERMKKEGIRATVDAQAASLGKKIRNAELQKVPLTAVVGAKEAEDRSLAIRQRKVGDLGSFSVDDVVSRLHAAVKDNTAFNA
uniref:Threonyl-tRNA synthetase n=1 Tax=Hemiselmis tepida TaxID=464990 RepID=A0A7S0Z1A8_9CRYP|mmetsp:Transcript_38326/g.97997  ORF Transcript_38326/g.97997 Transcript_38326/m.97997 type:complete len:197 (+) Transcript_38326:1-591(+)